MSNIKHYTPDEIDKFIATLNNSELTEREVKLLEIIESQKFEILKYKLKVAKVGLEKLKG